MQFKNGQAALDWLVAIEFETLPYNELISIIKLIIAGYKDCYEANQLLKALVDIQQTTIDLQNVIIANHVKKENQS